MSQHEQGNTTMRARRTLLVLICWEAKKKYVVWCRRPDLGCAAHWRHAVWGTFSL